MYLSSAEMSQLKTDEDSLDWEKEEEGNKPHQCGFTRPAPAPVASPHPTRCYHSGTLSGFPPGLSMMLRGGSGVAHPLPG